MGGLAHEREEHHWLFVSLRWHWLGAPSAVPSALLCAGARADSSRPPVAVSGFAGVFRSPGRFRFLPPTGPAGAAGACRWRFAGDAGAGVAVGARNSDRPHRRRSYVRSVFEQKSHSGGRDCPSPIPTIAANGSAMWWWCATIIFRNETAAFDDRRVEAAQRRFLRPRKCGGSVPDPDRTRCSGFDNVDNVQRTARGWLVSGALFNGSPFQCRIGNNGRIDGIDFGGGFFRAPACAMATGDGCACFHLIAPCRRAVERLRASCEMDARSESWRWAEWRPPAGPLAGPTASRGPRALPRRLRAAGSAFDSGPMPPYPGGPGSGRGHPETIDE